VKGWDAAVTQLSVGEKATCVFPARLAYGEKGFPGLIPKNAELHVTLELVAISMGD
jgi:FKBP-type peptidyl-prolyl cis-trans isomerase